jgi:hypothetical protein
MYKNSTKCNKTQSKWCLNKHGASKIIDTFETYHSLGTPGMSFGDHAKMSRFSWRKLVSSLSYLAERLTPMVMTLVGSFTSSRIFFVSLAGWNCCTSD